MKILMTDLVPGDYVGWGVKQFTGIQMVTQMVIGVRRHDDMIVVWFWEGGVWRYDGTIDDAKNVSCTLLGRSNDV